jgi:hypothetical protein
MGPPCIGRFVMRFPRRSEHSSISCGRPWGAAPFRAGPYPPRLSPSPGVLSREILPHFLPVGNYFTKWALHFLPVGNQGLQVADFPLTDRALPRADAA